MDQVQVIYKLFPVLVLVSIYILCDAQLTWLGSFIYIKLPTFVTKLIVVCS